MKNEEKETYFEVFGNFTEQMAEIMTGKSHDYAAGQQNKDPLFNFREIAQLLHNAPITPYTIAMVYFLKHVFSLITFTKTGQQESGEGLTGRHIDVANYAFIMEQLRSDHVEWVKLRNMAKRLSEPGDLNEVLCKNCSEDKCCPHNQ